MAGGFRRSRNSISGASPIKTAGAVLMGIHALSPRDYVKIKPSDDIPGIEGYFIPIHEAASKQPGFMIPK